MYSYWVTSLMYMHPPAPILAIRGTVPPAGMFERVSRTSWGATQVGSLLYSNPAEETVAFQRETESHPRLNLSSTEAPQFTMKNSSPPSPHVLHLSGLILQPPRQITPDIITALVNYCSETSGTITRVQLCHGNYAG